MKKDKCKSTFVNGKVENDVVAVNPCVPVQLDLFNEVVESQLIANYNCINVTLRHTSNVSLLGYVKSFRDFVIPRVSLVVLQRCGLYEYRYTVVSNKDMQSIHSILFDFEETTLLDDEFSMIF